MLEHVRALYIAIAPPSRFRRTKDLRLDMQRY
jgi:hypothetical protein